MRLHVGKFGTEKFLHAFDGDGFHLVDHLATAVVALTGKAFGVLVGEVAAHGGHHLVAHEVLGSNELHTFQLALMLVFDEIKNFLVFSHCECYFRNDESLH